MATARFHQAPTTVFNYLLEDGDFLWLEIIRGLMPHIPQKDAKFKIQNFRICVFVYICVVVKIIRFEQTEPETAAEKIFFQNLVQVSTDHRLYVDQSTRLHFCH